MTYWQSRQPDSDVPMSNESKVVVGVGLAFATGDLLLSFSQMNLWYGVTFDTVKPLLFHAGISGVFAGGITFAIVGSIPLLIEWVIKATDRHSIANQIEKTETAQHPTGKPENDKRVVESVVNHQIATGEAWEIHMNNITLPDGRIRIGTRVVDIPDTVDYDHLLAVAKHRASNQLGNVSTVTLQNIGVTRNGKPPNAHSLIEWLLKEGVLKDNGERRPYSFTRLGEKLFPVYTSPLPRFLQENAGSGSLSGATDTTATTATASD